MTTAPTFRQEPSRRTVPLIRYHQNRWGYMKAAHADPKFTNGTHKVFRLKRALDKAALERSIDFLAKRHHILTAHVEDRKKGPVFGFDGPPPSLEAIDLSPIPPKDRLKKARKTANDLVWRLFPDEGPWLRVFAVSLGARDHVIGVVLHHFIADAVSVSIAAVELMAAYVAFAEGREPALPEVALQYTDYVTAINRWLKQGDSRGHEAFWRQRMAGAPPTMLPSLSNAAPDDYGLEASYRFRVPAELVAKIRGATKCNSIAMVTLVVAAMALALGRAGKTNDVVVQNCVSGRTDIRLSGTVGAFFDVVALRLELPERTTFGEVLKQARAVVMAGYAHQVFSWHLVKPLLSETGASDTSPILNFLNYFDGGAPKPSMNIKSFALLPPPPFRRKAKEYPNISVRVVHDATGISGTVEHLDICYTRATVARFARDFVAYLDKLLNHPNRRLD